MNMSDNESGSRWATYIKQMPLIGEWLEPSDKIAVLRMAGVIADASMMRKAGINYHKFKDAISDAFDLPRVRAVALVINSPGGAPAQCSIISSMIRRLSEEKSVPVFAFVEDVAASGGYWLACAADEIYAQETSIIGSIGVISAGFGFDEFIKKHDIQRRVHTSGRDKAFLDPFRPEKSDDIERLRTIQNEMHQSFKDWVRQRRGSAMRGEEQDLMEGAFWSGKSALDRGLIDGIGDIISIMKGKFGEDVKFAEVSPEKKGLLSQFVPFLGGEAAFDPALVIETVESKAHWSRFGL